MRYNPYCHNYIICMHRNVWLQQCTREMVKGHGLRYWYEQDDEVVLPYHCLLRHLHSLSLIVAVVVLLLPQPGGHCELDGSGDHHDGEHKWDNHIRDGPAKQSGWHTHSGPSSGRPIPPSRHTLASDATDQTSASLWCLPFQDN